MVLLPEGDKGGQIRLFGEPHDPEVARVDLEDDPRLRRDRPFVVGKPRPVCRPHLFQAGAAFLHHVGYPELPADLDQLAPRDDRLLPLGKRVEDQQDRGGVVVDDEGVLRPGQRAEEPPDVVVAEPPLPLLQVIFKVGVSPGDLDDPLDRLPAEGRPAEVRVEDHAGRVDHAAQPVGTVRLDDLRGPVGRLLRRRQSELFPLLPEDPRPKLLHNRPACLLHDLPRKPGETFHLFDPEHHLVDLRQILQQFLLMFIHSFCTHLYVSVFGKIRFFSSLRPLNTRGSRVSYRR